MRNSISIDVESIPEETKIRLAAETLDFIKRIRKNSESVAKLKENYRKGKI